AVGAFLPQIAYQANFSNADLASPEPPLSLALPGPTYGTGVLASVDLFTAGRRGAQRHAADAERTAADASLVDRTFGARLTVEVAFLDVLRAADLIKVSQARLARDQEALSVAQHRLEAGTTFRSDVLRAGVELSSAKEALLAAQAQHTSATFELGRVTGLGRSVGADEADSTIVRPLPMPDRDIVDLIVSGGPSVRSADASFDAANASVRAAKAQYFPTINASGGYSVYAQPATRGSSELAWFTRFSTASNARTVCPEPMPRRMRRPRRGPIRGVRPGRRPSGDSRISMWPASAYGSPRKPS